MKVVSFIALFHVCFLYIWSMVIKVFGLMEKTAGVLSNLGHLPGSEMCFHLHNPLSHLPLPED